MSDGALRSIARNTAWLTATQVVGFATRLVYVVLVARVLGPASYAQLAFTQSWYLAFLPVALFGIGPALVHLMAVDRHAAPDIAARALALRLAMTAVAGSACAALGWLFAPDRATALLISILVLALVGRAVNAWAQHLYAALEANHHTLRQELAFRTVELLLAIGALVAGGGVLALVSLHAATWLAQAAWSVAVAMRLPLAPAPGWRPLLTLGGTRPLVTLALPWFVSKLATDWRAYGTLVLFGTMAASQVAFGQFALAMQGLALATAAPVALLTAVQPALTRSAARGDDRDRDYAAALQRLGFVAGTGIALAGMALGAPFVTLVFGAAYAEAGRLLGSSLWCLIPIVAGVAWPPVAMARGALRTTVAANVAGAVVTTVALLALGPRSGAPGAIVAAGLGYATTPALVFALAVRRGWADWDRELLRPVCVALAGLVTYLLLAPWSPLVALAAGWATLVGGSLVAGVITPGERQRLVAWRARP